jgi:MFS family permease
MSEKSGTRGFLLNAVTMTIVAGLSLLVLLYVGNGEATRTYQQFLIEKLLAQGRVIQNTMQTYLQPGLPMKQFVGFKNKTEPILESDRSIAAMIAFDRSGRPVFATGDATIPLLPRASTIDDAGSDVELREDDRFIQVVLPLRNRFEQVGSLAVTMPRSVISARIERSFHPLVGMVIGAAALFGIFAAVGTKFLEGRRRRWLQIGFAATFLVASVFVIGTLIALYSDGAQAKAKAAADSLGQRLSGIVQYGVNITEIHGLDKVFQEYVQLNPEISAAALTVDQTVTVHTDPEGIGKPWVSDQRTYEYEIDLSRPGGRDIRIHVALPVDTIYHRIARSVKNFAALFIASAFMAGLFLQLGSALRYIQGARTRPADASAGAADQPEFDLVKPVFFIGVFVEHLTYAFLPQYLQRVVESGGLSSIAASAVFMSYYLCFALSLIPSGQIAQRYSARPLMYGGLGLAAIGLFILAMPANIWTVMLARSISGIGQGMLFIGVQSYLLAVAGPRRKTRGAAIIVFGFQSGMISGMAIGSLLVSQMGETGVFTMAAVIAAGMAVYTLAVLPQTTAAVTGDGGSEGALSVMLRHMRQVVRSFEFLRAIMLIGIPAKAVLTGVVIFALPILMSQAGYAQEDIGQILMIYALGVVIASSYISPVVDRTGYTRRVLCLGAVLSGVGLLMIGADGWSAVRSVIDDPLAATIVLIVGVGIVGLAHGLVNAPVITHVARSDLADSIGETSATAVYRFLERAGHIAGPLIVGQFFVIGGQNPVVVAWIGAAIIAFGLLFTVGGGMSSGMRYQQTEPAR